MDVKVIDKDGQWFVNRALFRFNDPTERADGASVNFEPGLPTRVKPTDWMKGQALIVPCDDPFTGDPPPVIETETLLRENPDNLANNGNAANQKKK